MLSSKEFTLMRKEIMGYDAKREELIKHSRVVLKKSKALIYSVQRGDILKIDPELKELHIEKQKLDDIVNKTPGLEHEGSYSEACQEFTEAILLLEFERGDKISTAKLLNVSTADYLMGMADVTGEMVRLAVGYAIRGDAIKAEIIKDNVDNIWREFLEFDFRNSGLRRKFDSIKYNLQKLENVLYDLKVKRNG